MKVTGALRGQNSVGLAVAGWTFGVEHRKQHEVDYAKYLGDELSDEDVKYAYDVLVLAEIHDAM